MSIDIDLYSPDTYVAGMPHDQYEVLRATAPVYHHPDPQLAAGYWAVTNYADVVTISRNPELFSSNAETCFISEMPEESKVEQRHSMVNMDPPEHTRQRSLVNRGFTPRTIGKLHEKIAEVCDTIVDEAIAKGEGDFVTMIAAELPLIVIAELIGVPFEDRHKLFTWSNKMLSGDDPAVTNPEETMAAMAEVYMYANELAADRRANPRDDIITRLISPDLDGNVLSEFEFDIFFVLLMVTGNETTRNALSGGMQALIENPEQWERLKADPAGLKATAAEEIVRWVSPVMDFRRTVMADTELSGVQLKAGDKVIMYYPSANRDEAIFENANTFDIGRDPNPHIGFGGGGPHFCLGRHLAKLEMELMLESLARKVERVELTGPIDRLRSNFINGIKSMPVRITPQG
ncbi:MAG: cytochrome [Mycobacterium sp.]|nr:cytochrome [Mycobacterium sp.]